MYRAPSCLPTSPSVSDGFSSLTAARCAAEKSMYALSGRLGSPLAARAAFARAFLPRLDPLRACFSPRGPPSPSPLPSSLLPPPLPSSSSEALAAPPSYDSSSLESSWRYLLGLGLGLG